MQRSSTSWLRWGKRTCIGLGHQHAQTHVNCLCALQGKVADSLLQRLVLKPAKISQLAEGIRAIAAQVWVFMLHHPARWGSGFIRRSYGPAVWLRPCHTSWADHARHALTHMCLMQEEPIGRIVRRMEIAQGGWQLGVDLTDGTSLLRLLCQACSSRLPSHPPPCAPLPYLDPA